MTRTVKIGGSLVIGILVLALLTLRLVGYEPQYLDPGGEEFANNNRIARPGLWLTGEVSREVVTNWEFVNNLDDPARRDTVMLETRTWYGIPHSVTIGIVGRGDKLYSVGAQLVGDQSSRSTALGFQQRPKESDGCSPIPTRLQEDVQDVTVLVYCAPQILLAPLDRDEHLVEMPGVSHPTAPAPQLPGVDRTEPLAPLPNRLVGDHHASLREEIFSIAEAETESIVEPDRVADDVGWESISVIAGRLTPHRPTLPLVAST